MKDRLAVFQGKKIRRKWYNNEWYFSVIDVVAVLTDQQDYQKARKYWNKLSQRLKKEGSEVVTKCHQLKILAEDSKLRLTDCASTENIFRIVQSIPSNKAEPFKQWLAKVGYERVKEIENPELSQERMKEVYRQKGYPDEWIEKRIRGMVVRQELTDEWDKRGVKNNEFGILTNEICNATFGLTPKEYKELKGLKSQNLRDHMNDLELIFTMLGEASTTKIAKKKKAKGFDQNKEAAKEAGTVAGIGRKELEKRIEEKVVNSGNYLKGSDVKKIKK